MFSYLDTKNLILIIIAVLNSILGLLIFLKNRRALINIFYGLTALSTSLWAVGLALFRMSNTMDRAFFWARFYYVAAALIGASFASFSYYFPYQEWSTKKVYKALFVLATILVIIISVWPELLVKNILFQDQEKSAVLTNFYLAYTFYFLICMIIAFINFIVKLTKANKTQKVQIQFVFIGTLLAAIWGIIFNLLFPLFNNYQFIWLGPYFTIIMVGFIAYAVIKHHLMNIKVIATELFAILVPLSLLVDIFLSRNLTELVFKGSLFLFASFFSILLVRSVIKEVKSKERMEKMARSLRKANIELQRLDKAKSEFISIASHQLRTPLTAIRGFISMVLEGDYGKIDGTIRDKLEKTMQSSQRLVTLVEDLLTLSRIEGGRLKYTWNEVNINELVQSVFEELEAQAKKKGLDYSLQMTDEDLIILGDENKLRQVIMNLIDNAIKYTPKGSVTVTLTKEDNQALFKVKDTGIGIAKSDIHFLFEKFSRGDRSPKLWTEGLGLGLYVARMMLQQHRGTIGADSEGAGKGSTFWVKIPLLNKK